MQDQNECSVESLIGEIQEVDCSNRPSLLHKTATTQEFVRKNGPLLLFSWDLRKKTLNQMFPNGWHFLVADRVGRFQSRAVSTVIADFKASDDICFTI